MMSLINSKAEDAACVFVCTTNAADRLRLVQHLTPEHFAQESCRSWWQAVKAQLADGKPTMFAHVVARLEADKAAPPYGVDGWRSAQATMRDNSRDYLARGGLPADEMTDQIIHDVTNAAQLRAVRKLCGAVLQQCETPHASGAELLAELAKGLPAAATSKADEDEDGLAFDEAAGDFARKIERSRKNTVPSPWRLLDYSVTLAPGTLHVLSAATGVGKSVVGVQYARACWRAGKWCLYFCLEMPASAMAARMTRQERGVNHRPQTDEEVAFLLSAMMHVRNEHPTVRFLQRPDRTVDSVAMAVQAWKARIEASGAELGLVVVDYLKLLSPSAEDERARRAEHQIMSEQARKLKLMAMQLQIPVLALAQLNREAEKAGMAATRGMMADSYAVLRHADAVYIMARDLEGSGPAAFKITKARDGDCGDMLAHWDPKTQTYDLEIRRSTND